MNLLQRYGAIIDSERVRAMELQPPLLSFYTYCIYTWTNPESGMQLLGTSGQVSREIGKEQVD